MPGVPIKGVRVHDDPGVAGSVIEYNEWTNLSGEKYISDARAPAIWNHWASFPFYCGPMNLYAQGIFPNTINSPFWEYEFPGEDMPNLSELEETCIQYTSAVPSSSSRLGILGSLPNSITLGSQLPFNTDFGPPQLYVYDKSRNVVAQSIATSVDSNGATATFPFPSSLSQDSYSLAVANRGSDGGIVPASVNVLSIASSQTITGNPFGVGHSTVLPRGGALITTTRTGTELAREIGCTIPVNGAIRFQL